MKHPEKRRRAAYLLDEIGGVSDFYLQEAIAYRPAEKRRPVRRILLIAASFSLLVILSVSLLLPAMRKGNTPESEGIKGSYSGDYPATPSNETVPADRLPDVIHTAPQESYRALSSPAAASILVNERHIFWEENGTVYVSRTLSQNEVNRLLGRIEIGASSVRGESSEQTCRVWISLGDGRVVTPYLKPSPGNVGTDLFDYEAECLPSVGFANAVSDILQTP